MDTRVVAVVPNHAQAYAAGGFEPDVAPLHECGYTKDIRVGQGMHVGMPLAAGARTGAAQSVKREHTPVPVPPYDGESLSVAFNRDADRNCVHLSYAGSIAFLDSSRNG